MPGKAPTAIWQVKEAKKLNETSKRLAALALNTTTSNADFYRAAIFEAVNINNRRKSREARARAAGQRVEGDPIDPNEDPNKRQGGIEVLNKDNIDPQTAKRLGKTQLDHIFHLCKRHKMLVDTATKSIDTTLHPRWVNRLASTKLKKQRQKLRVKRKKQAILAAANAGMPSKVGATDRANGARNGTSTDALGRNASRCSTTSNTSTDISHTSHTSSTASSTRASHNLPPPPSPLPTQYVRDELPGLKFPLTLKNYNSKRQVEGWAYDALKLKKLIDSAVSTVDMSEPHSRVRYREDVERKKTIALATGAGDPDDIRPGEYGLSFAQKQHWRMHLEQLNELVETAPVRIDAKIDKHVQRIWNLNRARGLKDVDKSRGMKQDFALTLKRDATRQQLLGWDGALNQLNQLCKTATSKIDCNWGERGPPRSIKGSGTLKVPAASIASRHGNKGVIDRYGRSNPSDEPIPRIRGWKKNAKNRKLNGKDLRQALKEKMGKHQVSVAHVEGLKHTEGLGLSFRYCLGGRAMIKTMTQLDVAQRNNNNDEKFEDDVW